MRILATVLARGGSKGVPGKNIRPLAGKPLIVYTLDQVNAWGRFDEFIVSTDSEEIARIASGQGVDVPFMRPPELAADSAGKIDALRHALAEAERFYGKRFDAVLDLDVTSPVRTTEDIQNVVDIFAEKDADCVFSVIKARKNPYFNMVEGKNDGSFDVCKKPGLCVTSRQAAPQVFEMNASIYIYKRDFLLDEENRTPYSKRTRVYEMRHPWARDIDDEIDLVIMEHLLKKGIVKI